MRPISPAGNQILNADGVRQQVNADGARQRAQLALAASPIYDLRGLHVGNMAQKITISGRVSSYYHKQLAQELVLAVAEGIEIVNTVDVH